MAVETSAGTLLHISAAKPATFDVAGYTAAGVVWTPVGEVVDLGEFGRKYTLIKHNPVANRTTQKYKGSYDDGALTLKLALDNDDAGQVICKNATKSDATFSVKITLSGGDTYFCQAIVMEFVIGGLTVDSVTSASIAMELTTTKAGVGIVELLVP